MPKKDTKDEKKNTKETAMLKSLATRLGLKEGELGLASEHSSINEVMSTGNAELDKIITPSFYEKHGRGGVPRGFLCEFYGPNAGGKSSLCMKIAASVTKYMKAKVLWIDAENSFMEEWAASHGIDLNLVHIVGQRDNGEAYLTLVETAALSGEYPLIVVDSLEALTPKVLLESDFEDAAKIGAKAQMMSRACPRITRAAKMGNCTVIFINQIRNKITMYGDPETTPGGEALKFYASLRLRVSQVSAKTRGILLDGEEIGIRSNVLIKKSRFGPPYRETIMSIYFGGKKPHPLDCLLDMALEQKLIKTKTKKTKGTQKNAETEDVQVFSYKPLDAEGKTIPGFEHVQDIEGFDDFKVALDYVSILSILERLRALNVSIDPEINHYVNELKGEEELGGNSGPSGNVPIE